MKRVERRFGLGISTKRVVVLGIAAVLLGYGVYGIGYNRGQHAKNQSGGNDTSQQASGLIAVQKPVEQWQPSDIDAYDLWNRTNTVRVQNGLAPLLLNPALNNSASAKCADMVTKNYWAHDDPAGQEPWHFIKEAGVYYRFAGENLAKGFDDAHSVFDGWMNSQEHKGNILNGSYTEVGFAVCKTGDNFPASNNGPTLLVIQHFIG